MGALEKHGDLVAGLGAMAWAVASLYAVKLAALVAPQAAAAFAVLAFGRWYAGTRKRKKGDGGAGK